MIFMCRHLRSHRLLVLTLVLMASLTGILHGSRSDAAMVRALDLDELADQADRIFRGTVVSVDHGTAAVGGGQVPVIVYRLRVSEAFKGSFDQQDGQLVVDLRMVTSPEGGDPASASRSRTFAFMPRLELGGEYLLMVTKPSSAGLAAPVGLGQGTFVIDGFGDQARVRNGFGNTALAHRDLAAGDPPDGDRSTAAKRSQAMTYAELADHLERSLRRSEHNVEVERVP
ncbi:MAG: hypothetical protein AAF481_01240 [Acidobacteriota bacterium]